TPSPLPSVPRRQLHTIALDPAPLPPLRRPHHHRHRRLLRQPRLHRRRQPLRRHLAQPLLLARQEVGLARERVPLRDRARPPLRRGLPRASRRARRRTAPAPASSSSLAGAARNLASSSPIAACKRAALTPSSAIARRLTSPPSTCGVYVTKTSAAR